MNRRILATTLAATLAPILLGAGPAFADPPASSRPSVILNDQLNWGDVFANMTVTSPNPVTDGLAASAASAGVTALASRSGGDLDMTSRQSSSGTIRARTTINAGDACCSAVGASTAHATALEASTVDGALALDAQQTAVGGEIESVTRINVRQTSLLAGASAASANTMLLSAENGPATVTAAQSSTTSARAITDVDACCSGLTTAVSAASANSFALRGRTSTIDARLAQSSTGPTVTASTDVFQMRGHDVVAASNATANSAVIDSAWGYASVAGEQTNASYVRGETVVTLRDWEGVAAVSGAGVGNSAMITNVGSDARADLSQTNLGGVDGVASFTGGAGANDGGAVVLNAAAVGNSFTGWVCSACGDARLQGAVSQTNGGSITATGTITSPGVGGAIGSATAVGNSATYITARRGD
ncbi:hypothetical protein GC169_07040 [bacterium]|nr:hypothetical protein [bacterium]